MSSTPASVLCTTASAYHAIVIAKRDEPSNAIIAICGHYYCSKGAVKPSTIDTIAAPTGTHVGLTHLGRLKSTNRYSYQHACVYLRANNALSEYSLSYRDLHAFLNIMLTCNTNGPQDYQYMWRASHS